MTEITVQLDIESLEITSQPVDPKGNIILDVRSKKTETTCHKCGKRGLIHHGVAPLFHLMGEGFFCVEQDYSIENIEVTGKSIF